MLMTHFPVHHALDNESGGDYADFVNLKVLLYPCMTYAIKYFLVVNTRH